MWHNLRDQKKDREGNTEGRECKPWWGQEAARKGLIPEKMVRATNKVTDMKKIKIRYWNKSSWLGPLPCWAIPRRYFLYSDSFKSEGRGVAKGPWNGRWAVTPWASLRVTSVLQSFSFSLLASKPPLRCHFDPFVHLQLILLNIGKLEEWWHSSCSVIAHWT